MNSYGLLWEMEDGKTLSQNIEAACAAHQRRLGMLPNVVQLHPDVEAPVLDGLEVIHAEHRQKGHLWVARDEEAETEAHESPQPCPSPAA